MYDKNFDCKKRRDQRKKNPMSAATIESVDDRNHSYVISQKSAEIKTRALMG